MAPSDEETGTTWDLLLFTDRSVLVSLCAHHPEPGWDAHRHQRHPAQADLLEVEARVRPLAEVTSIEVSNDDGTRWTPGGFGDGYWRAGWTLRLRDGGSVHGLHAGNASSEPSPSEIILDAVLAAWARQPTS